MMKHVIPTTPPRRPPPKSSPATSATPTSQSKTPSRTRTRVLPKSKGSSNSEKVSGGTRTQTAVTQKSKNGPIPVNGGGGDNEVEGGSRNRFLGVEQLRGRRRREVVGGSGREVKEKEELRRRVAELEGLKADFRAELGRLKEDLENSRRLNADLQTLNGKLSEDLAAAEAKIVALTAAKPDQSLEKKVDVDGECSKTSSKFELETTQKPIILRSANPHSQGDETVSNETPPTPLACVPDSLRKTPAAQRPSPPLLPPPPPPPPPLPLTPPRLPLRANSPRKPPPVVEFYHSLAKQEGKKNMNQYRPVGEGSAHSSIVGEIQNRSAHLLAIKADVESKGEFINDLIQRVHAAAYSDIEDLSRFVGWLDGQLSSLADERAVLKHFQWPERKADAMREAAIEYGAIKSIELEISSYADDANIPCGVALKKISNLLDKVERGIQRLVKLRNCGMSSYQSYNIPSDWMLDSGVVGEIKQASTKIANLYLRRVIAQVQSNQNLDRESTQQALLLQAVHFAYRIHQFAGGLDSDTTCAFEEIRQRIPHKLGGCGKQAF